jgi:YidC/Oxa1 family membrane protein insertase
MEENKKFDVNSMIGFILIGAILFWMVYMNQEEAPLPTTTNTEETTEKPKSPALQDTLPIEEASLAGNASKDSLLQVLAAQKLGAFASSEIISLQGEAITNLENENLALKISNKGGQIVEVHLKNHTNFKGEDFYLIKDNNSFFNIDFETSDGKKLSTKDLFFESSLATVDGKDQVSMKLKTTNGGYLEFLYTIVPEEYMMDFNIYSKNLSSLINTNAEPKITWQKTAFRQEKSISYENRYTEVVYQYEGNKKEWTGQRDQTEESDEQVDWVAFKQHFFTSILLSDTPFQQGRFISENLVKDEQVDTTFLKRFTAEIPLKLKAGEFAEDLNWYFGPSDYQILTGYDRGLDKVVPLGWGIFGWINRYVFIWFFGILSGVLPSYGLAIIVMTIVVRIFLSPVTYKSYLSQAKMKVLRPEITQINEKYKDNAMKKQQETMKLYSKTGVSPLAGCIPALLQIPVFYALFQFFPSAFQLRQKGFLWADDLASYDVIYEWDTYIPLISWVYGNHISLFPILASIAIFFYMQMTTGQNMQQMSQPGMPNMKFIMYLSPVIMLIFFNNYASGLSLYYFISNLITIGIMLVIKNVIIDEKKILAKIEENKKKPAKKKGKFARKMQEIMEQAEEQKKLREGKK